MNEKPFSVIAPSGGRSACTSEALYVRQYAAMRLFPNDSASKAKAPRNLAGLIALGEGYWAIGILMIFFWIA